MSERQKAAARLFTAFTVATANVIPGTLAVLGREKIEDDENPVLKSPAYFLEVFSPSGDLESSNTLLELLNSKTNYTSEGLGIEGLKAQFTERAKRAVDKDKIFGVFGGVTEAVMQKIEGGETILDNDLDVKMHLNTSRQRSSKMSYIRIYNPNSEKVKAVRRNSIVKVHLGFEKVPLKLVYEGIILNVEHEFEEGDTVMVLHCLPFYEALINRSTYLSSEISKENEKFSRLKVQVIFEEGKKDEKTGYYKAFEEYIKLINEGLNNSIWGNIDIALESKWYEKVKFKAGNNKAENVFIQPPTHLPLTITQLIDLFFNEASNGGRSGEKIKWWIDNSGTIKFNYKEEEEKNENDIQKAIIGWNTHKVRAVYNTAKLPPSGNSVALEDHTDIGKRMYYLVNLVGKPSVQLGQSMTINSTSATEATKERLGIIAKTEGLKSIFDEFGKTQFKIDSIQHIFDSNQSYLTTVGLVTLKEHTFNVETDPKKQKKQDATDGISGESEDYNKLYNEIQHLRSEKAHVFSSINDTDSVGIRYVQSKSTELFEKGFPNNSKTVLDGEGTFAKNVFTGTLGGGKSQVKPTSNNSRDVTVTSTWASVYVDNKEEVGIGIWYPLSTLAYKEQQQKMLVDHYDGSIYAMGREWIEGKVPTAFSTDYIMRTPARSVDIIPTEKNAGAHTGDTKPDQGSRTQIFNQYLVDANPLSTSKLSDVTEASGNGIGNSRPSIRRILKASTTNDSIGTADDQIVHMVTDNTRGVTTKRIARHAGTTRGNDGVMNNETTLTSIQPEIIDVLDDKATDGNRVVDYAHNSNGTSPIREILVGQSQIIVSGNETQPSIEMILKKDDANTPYFIMSNDGIELHFDRATSDADTGPGYIHVSSEGVTINANNITLGEATTLDTLTLNGNLTVKGTTTLEADVNVTNGEGGDDTFTIAAATGNTVVSGTSTLKGDVAVKDSNDADKFTIAASTGNTVVAGTSQLDGNVAVGANKFTIAASNGNTVVAGTTQLDGNVDINADLDVSGTTTHGA